MTAPRSPWTPDHPNRPNVVPLPEQTPQPEPERADGDILIDRPDIGDGAATLITAGQPIPASLVDNTRRPADATTPPKTKRR